jgi:hypothetical protein
MRCIDEVDIVITDSPLLLSCIYAPNDYPDSFRRFVLDVYFGFENINFLVQRQKRYIRIGRDQTENEAKEIDVKVMSFLEEYSIPYHLITSDASADDLVSLLYNSELIV